VMLSGWVGNRAKSNASVRFMTTSTAHLLSTCR